MYWLMYYSLLFMCSLLGFTFCWYQFKQLTVSLEAELECEKNKKAEYDDATKTTERISSYMSKEVYGFLKKKYQYIFVFSLCTTVVLYIFVNLCTSINFLLGGITSVFCGHVAMNLTLSNKLKTVHVATTQNLENSYRVALRMGTIIGYNAVCTVVFALSLLVMFYKRFVFSFPDECFDLFKALAAFGLGGSVVALFIRVGGNIYAKAAVIVTYVSGSVHLGIEGNDMEHPACIANRIGDGVGDIAGTQADLFGFLTESMCAAFLISVVHLNRNAYDETSFFLFTLYPLLLIGSSIVSNSLSYFLIISKKHIRKAKDIVLSLKVLLPISTVLQTVVTGLICYFVFPASVYNSNVEMIDRWKLVVAPIIGLWGGFFFTTEAELYTSTNVPHVYYIAKTSKVSAITGILLSSALGYQTSLVPVICLCGTLGLSHVCGEFYGVALAAIGMASTLCTYLTMNAFISICNNVHGIAEIAKIPVHFREVIDTLSAVGSSAKPLMKRYLVVCSAINDIAMYGALVYCANIYVENILNPFAIIGVLIGAVMPYYISSLSLVGTVNATQKMIRECTSQLPSILDKKNTPDYSKCVDACMAISLRRTAWSGLVVMLLPVILGFLLGKVATVGFVLGLIATGIPFSLSANNTSSALENAKKLIELGRLGIQNAAGSDTHNNIMISYIVGNTFQDISGQSLNTLIKLSSVSSLVFVSSLSQ